MSVFEEQEIIEKKFDLVLFLKLLSYAKPYLKWFVIALLFLLAMTGLELIRPVIIGKSIDKFINGFSKIYTIYERHVKGSVFFNGMYLVREDEKNNNPKAKIYYINGNYYLFGSLTNEEIGYLDKYDFSAMRTEDRNITVVISNNFFHATLLKSEDLKLLRKDDFSGLGLFSALFIIILILSFVLNYGNTLILQIASQKIIYNLRTNIFSHIMSLSHKFFDRNPVGRLVTRVTNDTETLNEMYTSVIVNLAKNFVLIIGIIIVMLVINLKLSLVTFGVIPFIILFTFLFRKFARKNYQRMRKFIAELNSFLQEHIYGIKIIQLFCVEKKKQGEFDRVNHRLYESYFREISIFSIFRPSIFFLYIVGVFLVMLFGGWDVHDKLISFGTLFIFLYYIQLFFDPIQELAEQFNVLQSAMASSERIFMLLDEKPDIVNVRDPVRLEKIRGNIEFRNVTFGYNNNDWILKNINFKIRQGEKIALVGHTGSGKTTIINLLGRFYDVQKGKIFIDGIDIKNIEIESLRKNIGQVMQDVFLFTGTIKSNIKLLNDEIKDEDVISSCNYVNACFFVDKFKERYDHPVSERGSTLSTGQRQLLSFARTICYNPSVLVLDEATANIDTETENYIQDALEKMLENKTSIVVAHRLSTIRYCDRIIVLNRGIIKEMGTHDELMKNKGIYYDLYKLNYDLE